MIRTGDEYKASLQDGREVYICEERVKHVTSHPIFKPLVDIRARIYDMQHDAATRDVMTYTAEQGEDHAIGLKMPHTQQDWHDKRVSTDAVFDDIGRVVTRVGEWLKGVFPVSTGIVVAGLGQAEWLMKIDVIAVIPE